MIVNDIKTITAHVAVISDKTINFASLEKFVEVSENWVKVFLLGPVLYKLIDKQTPPKNCGCKCHTELKNKVQRIIALDSFDRAVPMLDLALTSAGFGVSNNEKIAPASKDRVTALREGLKNEVGEAIEDLLIYLENHEELHGYWKDSPTYSLNNDTYLPTYTIFKRYAPYTEATKAMYPINRLMFANFIGKLRSYMQLKITPAIGELLTLHLLNDEQNDYDNVNVDRETACRKLLEILRFALAYYALGLDEMGDNFITQALSFIKDNPDEFDEYVDMKAKFAGGDLKDGAIINMC